MNPDGYLSRAIIKTGCQVHKAKKGQPCFEVESTTVKDGSYSAICNRRAKHAGFDGKIQPGSITSSRGPRKGNTK